MKRFLAVFLLLACNAYSASPFDEAQEMTRDMGRARELYDKAAQSDPDPDRRERAVIRSAVIDWYVFHDAPAARAKLAKIPKTSRNAAAAAIERARLEKDLAKDFAAARAAAEQAQTLPGKTNESEQARIVHAAIAVDEARQARWSGKCPEDSAALRAAAADLRRIIEKSGPLVETSLLLLNAALMLRDDAMTVQAWRWYYSDLPTLVPSTLASRRALGLALAESRLYEEAELVLRDPCAPVEIDAELGDIVTWGAALRRLGAIADEQHRAVARGINKDNFHKDVAAVAQSVWNALAWKGERPKFSLLAAQEEFGRRFGMVATLGQTGGVFDMVLAHAVRSEQREVEQYGKRAPFRFVLADGLIAGGYLRWVTRGGSSTGGWTTDDSVVQLRPGYADGAVQRWRRITDPNLSKERDEAIADETRRDEERAKQTPIAYFRGLEMRLNKQYSENVRDSLVAKGLTGDALREAFIERVNRELFEASIWAHEGRHAIDKKVFNLQENNELEFRAKLSQIAFAPGPRGAFPGLLFPVGGPTPHGNANQRALKGAEQWMRAHAKEIQGLDPNKALLPQMDRLTDDQLKEAFRSQDPLAKVAPLS